MLPPLLQSKLFIPLSRPGLVSRLRLQQKLDQARIPGSRIILISAPAGFGKTTVMTQWIQATGWPVAWISLDEGDNLPTRFFRYLIAALQKISPAIGQSALE